MAKEKYKGKSVAWLKRECQKWFNRYIRIRDDGKPCISCGNKNTSDASHFFSVRMYDALRFDEDNAHKSCTYCNRFAFGNIFYYTKRLPDRIGKERFDALVKRAEESKKSLHKWNRWELIELIETYKQKCKDLSGR